MIGLLRTKGNVIVVGDYVTVLDTAKYGIFTCMELILNCVIYINIVTSTEVWSRQYRTGRVLKSLN